jgi:hypothetical protein
MPRVRFGLTIQTIQRAKTVHALDCAATVIGPIIYMVYKFRRARGSAEVEAPCYKPERRGIASR